jgi:tRNA(His) 5'-end guanylyltransferase
MKKKSIDSLGDRMKKFENIYRTHLLPRIYTILRVDGKAFHTFTKGLHKPWDDSLADSMMGTAIDIYNNVQGSKFAYTQSDEISLVFTDFDTFETQAWFGNNIQKICSVSGSIATRAFNQAWIEKKVIRGSDTFRSVKWAEFDARVFQLPNKEEVINYFIWRQQDAIRNSIQMLAQSFFSQNKMHKKNQSELIEMCRGEGTEWGDLPTKYKRGVGIKRWVDDIGEGLRGEIIETDFELPIFSEKRDYIGNLLPDYI